MKPLPGHHHGRLEPPDPLQYPAEQHARRTRQRHLQLRSSPPPTSIIHHSDQGSQGNQHGSALLTEALAAAKARRSMSRRGNGYDNAAKESFFGSFELEFELHRAAFDCLDDAIIEANASIKYYNHDRTHSSLGYVTRSNSKTSEPQKTEQQN